MPARQDNDSHVNDRQDAAKQVPEGRDEMRDAPPFLSWTAIYLIVLGALATQVAVYAALTAIYR